MREEAAFIKCSRCGEVKPADQYCWKRRDLGRRDCYCRPCRREYGRGYYAANRERRIAQDAARKWAVRVERTMLLLEFFAEHPCSDCGEDDPVVLEFDHLRDKAFAIGSKLTHMPWTTVLSEMEKCEVVCANCHRRRTEARRGSLRTQLTRAGGGNRTRTERMETSHAAITPRPREAKDRRV